jgi:hypothetical protein
MPNDAAGHFNLGLLLEQTGDTPGGSSEIATALKLDPSLSSRLPSPSPSISPTVAPSPSPSASPSEGPSPKPSSKSR